MNYNIYSDGNQLPIAQASTVAVALLIGKGLSIQVLDTPIIICHHVRPIVSCLNGKTTVLRHGHTEKKRLRKTAEQSPSSN